ncbi:MAG: hypothetical protein JRG79_01070 [Deltaproteobacteria bacterium]|nr:hypothetical protein [Deltaproteobacteria bacterium]MBW1942530.1 hypothetical protein [Deltaproteobacteria bacterium]MBW2205473.1 hypothetical protein [Deltaproteobacteria bacterium]
MPENRIEGKDALWMLIEEQIENYTDEDFSGANSLETSRKIADELDKTGYNVSKSGGNWLQLKTAVKARNRVGRPFMQDLNQAVSALGLDEIIDTYATAMKIMSDLGTDWPSVLASEHRADVDEIVGKKKVELMVARAKELPGEEGARYLISESFESQAIMEALGVSEDEYKNVKSKVDAELAEKARVEELFAAVKDASEEDKIKHLLNKNAADELITEIGGIEQSAIDAVKKTMEKELAEKKKKDEELAAQKAAEAAGPSLENIDSDDMLEYIEGIREILEFSDVEKDIRTMCEQSSIPKDLVDIAISDPDKLDEMEKEAGG